MKRYTILNKKAPDSLLQDLIRYEDPNGKWLRWEDHETELARLKELNRELVEMLEDVLYYELPSDVYATIKELLAKTEGEGECL